MKHGPGSLESMLLEINRAWTDDLCLPIMDKVILWPETLLSPEFLLVSTQVLFTDRLISGSFQFYELI